MTELSLRRLLFFFFLILLMSAGLHVLVALLAPEGMVFTGGLVNHADVSVYLAALRQGAAGEWLYTIQFSPEPWQPVLMYPMYMLLGKLLPAVNGNYQATYDFLRFGSVLLAGLAVWWWLRELLPGRERLQCTGWLLIVFGSGFGWLFWTLAGDTINNLYALLPDVGGSTLTFVSITLAAPHFALGLALEIMLFVCLVRMARPAAGVRWAIAALLLFLALISTYVYHVVTAGFIIGLYLLQQTVQQRRIPWRLWFYGAIVLLPAIPFLYYYAVWINRDPVWAEAITASDLVIPPPAWWALVLGLGILAVLALVGGPRWFRDRQEPLVFFWILGNILVLYLPAFAYAGRFMVGLKVR